MHQQLKLRRAGRSPATLTCAPVEGFGTPGHSSTCAVVEVDRLFFLALAGADGHKVAQKEAQIRFSSECWPPSILLGKLEFLV